MKNYSLTAEPRSTSDIPICGVLLEPVFLTTETYGERPIRKVNFRDPRNRMFPIPPEKTENIYLSGIGGCGKSVFCAEYANRYLQIFEDRQVFLVSFVKDDKVLDRLEGLVRVPLQDIVDGKVTIKNFQDSLVIFDDVDSMPPASEEFDAGAVFKAVANLRDACLTTGRHYNCSILVTSHLGANGAETKKSINEATKIVVFPAAGSHAHMERLLRHYCGLKKAQFDKIIDLGKISRWVCYHRGIPSYVIHERGVYLL
jgi:hypothetical protein